MSQERTDNKSESEGDKTLTLSEFGEVGPRETSSPAIPLFVSLPAAGKPENLKLRLENG